ncbi:protein kinase [Lachnospiraceae bacterium 48-33]
MSETVRSLANLYGVTVDQAIQALEANNIIILSEDTPITNPQKLAKFSQVISEIDLNERQRQYLSRDYVIFTHMALRKPIAANILRQVIELKTSRKTKTRIVVCSETVDYVTKVAKVDNRLQTIADSLDVLKRYNMLTILPGRISEENHSISSFIKKCTLSNSILIVGVNRSLSTFVCFRNKNNQSDCTYVRIFERDITSKGFLVNPNKRMVAFEDPADKSPAPFSDAPVNLSSLIPLVGQYVYYKQKSNMTPLLLESEVGSGGEAYIYKVFSGTKCAKIFKAESNSELKMKKIAIMCSKCSLLKRIDMPIMERIAWPEKIIYNEHEEPIGYIMNLFEGTTPFSDFAYDTFEEIIPGVKKKHQVTMAVNFAELIDFMHHNNIILCDINRGNVLFDKNQMAYLVDLDSAQIADQNYFYPSNVGIPEFLSPEHIYDKTFSFKRKKADDVWILQMLLFHMLTPDGDPYATSKDFDDEREIIAKGYYPYQAKNNAAEPPIKGSVWHMIVGHFPLFVKEMFWNSFHGKGAFFHEADRKSSWDWLNTMVRYQECLPDMVKSDAESGKYMPTAYRKHIQSQDKVNIIGGSLDDLLKKFSSSGSRNINWNDLN